MVQGEDVSGEGRTGAEGLGLAWFKEWTGEDWRGGDWTGKAWRG
jgi:hypothetical protein